MIQTAGGKSMHLVIMIISLMRKTFYEKVNSKKIICTF